MCLKQYWDIQKLRKKGILCAVATNQDKYRTQYMLEKMGFNHSFDNLFASAHLGEVKKSEGFFEVIVKEYKAEPNEVVFWDDDESHVNSARKVGIIGEVYKNFRQYKMRMDKLAGV